MTGPQTANVYRIIDTLGDADDSTLVLIDDFVEGIGNKAYCAGGGVRLGAVYPPDARISLRKENPGMKLSSLLGNTRLMLIVSREFKEIIARTCTNEIEYLPFRLYDHRKRVLSADYFIVNPIGTLDCLDLKKSDIDWSDDTPPELLGINEHVLDRKRLVDAPELFRIKEDPGEYVIGPRLAEAMRAHQPKLTNIQWTRLRYADEL